jgi:DNA polymerase-3 subunit epsilon
MGLDTGDSVGESGHLARPIGGVPLAFVDVETTGFSARNGDRVCEIAIVRRVGERVEERLASLVNPECRLRPRAAAVNGITREMIRDAPCFRDVAAEVARLLDGAAFVAHNAGFDRGFLHAEFARVGRIMPPTPTIDTLALARAHLVGVDHSLGSLASLLSLAPGGHRAGADVEVLCRVFDHLVRQLGGWSTPLGRFVGAPIGSGWRGREFPRRMPPWLHRRQQGI